MPLPHGILQPIDSVARELLDSMGASQISTDKFLQKPRPPTAPMRRHELIGLIKDDRMHVKPGDLEESTDLEPEPKLHRGARVFWTKRQRDRRVGPVLSIVLSENVPRLLGVSIQTGR